MKLLFSGYVLQNAIDYAEHHKSRSFSIWTNKIRSGDVSVIVIRHRNQMEKQKILDFIADFEENAPHIEDPK